MKDFLSEYERGFVASIIALSVTFLLFLLGGLTDLEVRSYKLNKLAEEVKETYEVLLDEHEKVKEERLKLEAERVSLESYREELQQLEVHLKDTDDLLQEKEILIDAAEQTRLDAEMEDRKEGGGR